MLQFVSSHPRQQAYGLPVPVELLIGAMVPVVGIGMWTAIHKSKAALMLMHGSKSKPDTNDTTH